jgi:hypothetical protein
VGQLLVDAGRFRQAWLYLRPTGEKLALREALQRTIPTSENVEELIQIALEEGVAPERGLAWMLAHYGTCNSITAFDAIAGTLSPPDQKACATVLVRHLHSELSANVKAHIERKEDRLPRESTLAAMISDRGWLFDNDTYHIDTSHLASVVRFARLLDSGAVLRQAVDLTEYGCRLGAALRYPGEPPFEDVYPSHRRLSWPHSASRLTRQSNTSTRGLKKFHLKNTGRPQLKPTSCY